MSPTRIRRIPLLPTETAMDQFWETGEFAITDMQKLIPDTGIRFTARPAVNRSADTECPIQGCTGMNGLHGYRACIRLGAPGNHQRPGYGSHLVGSVRKAGKLSDSKLLQCVAFGKQSTVVLSTLGHRLTDRRDRCNQLTPACATDIRLVLGNRHCSKDAGNGYDDH